MNAWFNQEFEEISKEDFDIVYAEYIDVSGLYLSKEFELVAYIAYLKNRIFILKTLIATQRMCIDTFHKPYIEGIELFSTFGYKVEWDGDEKKFLAKMDKMSSVLRSKSTELRHKEFEYEQLKAAKKEKAPEIQSRHEFIRMLNSFSKYGFSVDKNKTTVEELALMIKQIQDESTKLAINRIQHT